MMTRDQGTVSDYVAHLEACDHLFPTKLSERVALEPYALKLYERATSYEIWNDGRLVGLIAAYMDTDIVFISHICVLPEAPSGSGHALLEALCEEAIQTNKRKIHLHVEAMNERAIAFYMRHGFSELDRTGDVLVMESVL